MIELFIITIAVAVISFYAGWRMREKAATWALAKMRSQLADVVDKLTTEVAIEERNDVYFVYNKSTGEFLAQGSSYDEVTSILKTRYPNSVFVATTIPEKLRKDHYRWHDDTI